MHVTHHRRHLFDDGISFEGGMVADRRANSILLRESVDRLRYQFPRRRTAAVVVPQLNEVCARERRGHSPISHPPRECFTHGTRSMVL
jgi:hypothetical protein